MIEEYSESTNQYLYFAGRLLACWTRLNFRVDQTGLPSFFSMLIHCLVDFARQFVGIFWVSYPSYLLWFSSKREDKTIPQSIAWQQDSVAFPDLRWPPHVITAITQPSTHPVDFNSICWVCLHHGAPPDRNSIMCTEHNNTHHLSGPHENHSCYGSTAWPNWMVSSLIFTSCIHIIAPSHPMYPTDSVHHHLIFILPSDVLFAVCLNTNSGHTPMSRYWASDKNQIW